jgi:hypothetical protein
MEASYKAIPYFYTLHINPQLVASLWRIILILKLLFQSFTSAALMILHKALFMAH